MNELKPPGASHLDHILSLLPLSSHHDDVENGSSDDADDEKERGTGVVVDDDDENDDAEDEDENGEDERHSNRPLSIRLLHAQVKQSSQRYALKIKMKWLRS